jgi:hypothetical protein
MSKKSMAFLAAASLLLASAVTPDAAFADDIRVFKFDGIKTIDTSHVTGFFVSGFSTSSEYVASAKVIVENRSSGVRAVQCQLRLDTTQVVDFANAILGPGETTTLSMLREKDGTNDPFAPRVTCIVFSTATDGVVAGWVRLVQHFGTVR